MTNRVLSLSSPSVSLAAAIDEARGYLARVTATPWIAERGWKPAGSGDKTIVILENARSESPERDFLSRFMDTDPIDAIRGEGYLLFSPKDTEDELLVIAGATTRGAIYAINDFMMTFLGVDPYEFWSERTPLSIPDFHLPRVDKLVRSPLFDYRVWMDDDSDELLNYTGEKLVYAEDTWRGVVSTLTRTGYNAVWLCDTLGRGEFYLDLPFFRDHYRRVCPNYQTDLGRVEWLIDYAHERGLMVGANLILSQFNQLRLDQTHWENNRNAFVDAWRKYLTVFPTRKADFYGMFSLSPFLDGSPFYGDAAPTRIAQEQIWAIDALLREYKPDAKVLYCAIRSEADMAGLEFPDTFIPCAGVVKKDAPYVDPDVLETIKAKRVPSGIFTHACLGTHYHHIIQDPIPERIGGEVRKAVNANATTALVLDGQVMRNFFLNLSAMSAAVWDFEDYDGERFAARWAERHFGATAAEDIVGVFATTREIHANVYAYNMMLEQYMWRNGRVRPEVLEKCLALSREALAIAEAGLAKVAPRDKRFYLSCVEFPVRIFHEAAKLCARFDRFVRRLPELETDDARHFADAKTELTHEADELERAAKMFDDLLSREPIEKFKNWYLPENQRLYVPTRRPEFYRFVRERLEDMTFADKNGALNAIRGRLNEWAELHEALRREREKYHV